VLFCIYKLKIKYSYTAALDPKPHSALTPEWAESGGSPKMTIMQRAYLHGQDSRSSGGSNDE